MIKRIRDYGKKEPSRDAHKIYVVCEGSEDEKNYFSFFEGLSSNLNVITIPSEEGRTDPLQLMARAKVLFDEETGRYSLDYKQGDRVWFVVDTDTWEDEGKIAPLRAFCEEMNEGIPVKLDEVKQYNSWNVISTLRKQFRHSPNPSAVFLFTSLFFSIIPYSKSVSRKILLK